MSWVEEHPALKSELECEFPVHKHVFYLERTRKYVLAHGVIKLYLFRCKATFCHQPWVIDTNDYWHGKPFEIPD